MALELFANPWLNAIALFVAFVIIAKLFLWLIQVITVKVVSRTKTDIDDQIVKRTNKPLTFILVLIGARLISNTLVLTPNVIKYGNLTIDTLIYACVVQIVAALVDIFISNWGKKWSSRTKSKIDDQIIVLLNRASAIVIWIVGILWIMSMWGVEITPLIASMGIAGLAIAFALQTTLGNVFGGISLILDKNIAVGDVIDVSGDGMQKGEVLDIGLRSTKIRTFDNETIIVPNGSLSESTFKNVTQPNPGLRVVIPFGVEYGAKIDEVKRIVLKEIGKIPGLDPEKDPFVKFLEMGDSSLNFKAYFHIVDYTEKLTALDLANTLIYDALNKAKIEIPYPQMDVHVKK